MNFNLSEEQVMLKDSVQKFITNDYDYETRRKRVQSEKGYSDEVWKTFAELGWLCVPFSEDDGGIGGGAVETMIMMEAFGKGLVLEPYVSTVILAGSVLRHAGNESQKAETLGPIMDGSYLLSLAYAESQARFDLFDVATSATAESQGYCLNGVKSYVLQGGSADGFIVSARTSGERRDQNGISLFLVSADQPGVSVQSYPTLDGQRAAEVTFSNVMVAESTILGEVNNGYGTLRQVEREACLALSAEAVGMIEKLYCETVEYAKTRKQFGVPISVFQALQHRMVDMYSQYEECKSLLLRAIMSVQNDDENADKNVSALKYAVGVKGQKVAHEAIQLFGGMGMTDEISVGMCLKRINVINTLFGSPDFHLKRVLQTSIPQ